MMGYMCIRYGSISPDADLQTLRSTLKDPVRWLYNSLLGCPCIQYKLRNASCTNMNVIGLWFWLYRYSTVMVGRAFDPSTWSHNPLSK